MSSTASLTEAAENVSDAPVMASVSADWLSTTAFAHSERSSSVSRSLSPEEEMTQSSIRPPLTAA